jgi:5-methylcytosine-specific restriction endonuclease McrA
MADVSTVRRRAVASEDWGKPERDESGAPICRRCRGPVAAPRRTFCSDVCVHEWKVRSDPGYVRDLVWKRDGGICRLCGVNLRSAERKWSRSRPHQLDRPGRRRWRAERPRWEADHILPVADGGGECGLDNYRLLCRTCHVNVTQEWRRRRGTDFPIGPVPR